jgi:hypothetical protein
MAEQVEWSGRKRLAFILSAGAVSWVVVGLIVWIIYNSS